MLGVGIVPATHRDSRAGKGQISPCYAWIIPEAGDTIKGFIGTVRIRAWTAGLWGLSSPGPLNPSFQGGYKTILA